MDTLDQLELLDAFRVSESDLVELDDNDEHRNFGKMSARRQNTLSIPRE